MCPVGGTVDALVLGTSIRDGVRVRVPCWVRINGYYQPSMDS
jgi:hypothetical protein